MENFYCILVGYIFGSFLTAPIVARIYTGRPISTMGRDGNPGMANVIGSIGFVPGLITLAGDTAKCLLSAWLCMRLWGQTAGRILFLYNGLGNTLGHCFPFWRRFHGGKGVVTICTAIILYRPLWGMICCMAGGIIVLITHYLSIGGILIPFFFAVLTGLFDGVQPTAVVIVLGLIGLQRHFGSLKKDLAGQGKRVDLIGKLRKIKTRTGK